VTGVTAADDQPTNHLSVRSKTVLVIDPAASMRQLLAEALPEVVGVRVLVAADGAEGVEVARREGAELVLVHLRLPRLDGFGVLSWLRSCPRTSELPAVVITAMSEDVARPALAAGHLVYLRKPFDLYELADYVRQGLDGGCDRAERRLSA
jgi:CheY-like chemotaxis protein